MTNIIDWLLASNEPWTRYRALVDLLDHSIDSAEAKSARQAMLAHPQVQALIHSASTWSETILKRHNDASHPLYKLSTLADFGVQTGDPGMTPVIETVLSHQSPEGTFQTLVFIPSAFGGSNQEMWSWMACDAPTLLYVLAATGLGSDSRIQNAARHLASLIDENGWRCVVAPELGRFHGPGRRSDPCPIANVYALKALSLFPEFADGEAARKGVETLLRHWEHQATEKPYLFGMGTDFRKLKYPFVWYDILHVTDVLSRFPFVYTDPRFTQMVETITAQADQEKYYTPNSMYLSWKGWSFADKKSSSPWLTFLVLRILKRIEQLEFK